MISSIQLVLTSSIQISRIPLLAACACFWLRDEDHLMRIEDHLLRKGIR